MQIPRSLGVHSGSFHADEVTACAFLLLYDLIDKEKIFRTREMSILDRCEYVCDVGGIYDPKKKRFDHHQIDYKGYLSSAGMILLYLKENGFMGSHLYDTYHKTLVMGVDAHDNGLVKIETGTSTFSQVISNFLPISYEASDQEMMHAFLSAVHFVFGHLDRIRKRFQYVIDCSETVRKTMEKSTHVLIFDESIPWMDSFFELGGELHSAEFVIMPSQGQWKLRGIPPSLQERLKVRRPLPEAWGGLLADDLKRVSQIPGAIFCHKGRFISIWETKEDAERALRIAMQR